MQGFSILFNDIRLRGVPETAAAEPFAFSPITLFNERSRGVQILVGGVHFRQKRCAHFNYSSRAQKKGRKTCSPKIRTTLRPCILFSDLDLCAVLENEGKDEYQVLLVANKYQTGFDQPKLCAMYVLKKLKGVSAVQTLSRLNRICPPFEKKTFVLDFVNTYEDIKAAFAPYYTTTLLSTSVTPTAIYDLEAQIDAYTVLDPDDIEKANELLYKGNISSKDLLPVRQRSACC